ncbi:E3 ubiquitin-protein ligase RNF8-like [Drosophila innubila]|uniref:E3 ubiquitin-protein ligase RNF8-like n=1 Tax=Drosophila innubila TaxID=198719 RepID=UPI00148D02FB|nr:E3 ubiquitin-protein ligase RNF8-like [Drosophila innubila]
MAEIQSTLQNIAEGILNEVAENLELANPEADNALEVEKSKDDFAKESAAIIQQVKELSAAFEKLVLQIKPQNSDDQNEVGVQNIDSFYDLHRLWQEQVANLTAIQNMQAEDFQKQILEKDQVRQKLLADLENQGHAHLVEIEKLKKQFIIDLEAKDKICLELEEQIERQRGDHEESVSCSICLDPWTLSGYHRLVSLACGHLFGDPCIREFLAKQQICPQCRAHAQVGDIRYLFGRPI